MKKDNLKRYLFLTLVFITSFFAFNGKVVAQTEKIGLFLFTGTEDTEMYKVHGAFSAHPFSCSFSQEGIVKNYRPSSWNHYIKGLKAGNVSVTCTDGNSYDVSVYDQEIKKKVVVEHNKSMKVSDFIKSTLGIENSNVNVKLRDGKLYDKNSSFYLPSDLDSFDMRVCLKSGNKCYYIATLTLVANNGSYQYGGSENITVNVGETFSYKKYFDGFGYVPTGTIDDFYMTSIGGSCTPYPSTNQTNNSITFSNASKCVYSYHLKHAGSEFYTLNFTIKESGGNPTPETPVTPSLPPSTETINLTLNVGESKTTKKLNGSGSEIIANTCYTAVNGTTATLNNGTVTVSVPGSARLTEAVKCSIGVKTSATTSSTVAVTINPNTIQLSSSKLSGSLNVPGSSGRTAAGSCLSSSVNLSYSGSTVTATMKEARSGTYTCYVALYNGEHSTTTVHIQYNKAGGTGGGGGGSYVIPAAPEVVEPATLLDEKGLCSQYVVSGRVDGFNPDKSVFARANVTWKGTTKSHNILRYEAIDQCEKTNKYEAICYDPNSKAPNGVKYEPEAYVNPFDDVDAFAGFSNNNKIEAFALSMVQNHFAEISGNKASVKGKLAAQIAIRTYIWGNNFTGSAPNGTFGSNNTHAYYYRILYCKWSGSCSDAAKDGDWSIYTVVNEKPDGLENMAKAWWQQASDVADKACPGSGPCSPVDGLKNNGFSIKFDKSDAATCSTKGSGKELILKGKITGLQSYKDDSTDVHPILRLDKFECVAGLTCQLYIKNIPINAGDSLLDKGFGNEEEIKVVVTGDICSKINDINSNGVGKLNFSALNSDDWRNIITLKPIKGNYQRMFIIKEIGNGDPTPVKIPVGDDLNVAGACGCSSCESIDPNTNEAAFKKSQCCKNPVTQTQKDFLKTKPANYCDRDVDDSTCGKVDWDLTCGPNGESKKAIHEGIDTSKDTEDLKKCVVDKTDKAGNTFLKQEVKYTNLNNSTKTFCKIYCYEDWDLTLPGVKENIIAGTGLDLSIKNITGKRTCFTNINTTTFEDELESINSEIINRYNDYKRAYELITAFNNATESKLTLTDAQKKVEISAATCVSTTTCTRGTTGCSNYGTATSPDYRKKTSTSCTCPSTSSNTCVVDSAAVYAKCTAAGTEKKKTVSDVAWAKSVCTVSNHAYSCTTSNQTEETKPTYGYFDPKASGKSCDTGYVDPETDFIASHFSDEGTSLDDILEAKEKAYEDAIAKRKELINTYNKCSTYETVFDWTKNQSLPKISYIIADADTMSKIKGNNEFVVDGDISHSVENIFCKGNSNETYTGCATAESDQDKTKSEERTLPGSDTISSSKLGTAKKTIPINKYIKKSETNGAKFNFKGYFYMEPVSGYTYYVVSQNGADKNSILYTGEKWEDYYGTKEKLIPISVTLPAGRSYEYQYKFSNMGVYNNNENTYGRIVGDGKSVVKSVATKTTETCAFKISEIGPPNCTCCGKEVEATVASLEVCHGNKNCKITPPGKYLSENADLGYFARTISLNDMNPNNRQLGTNWGGPLKDGEKAYPRKDAIIRKGSVTKSAIEDKGYGAYETPEYSYTITPTGIASIRNTVSNYSNSTLSCNDGVECVSSFLEDINKKKLKGVTENARNATFAADPNGSGLSWK